MKEFLKYKNLILAVAIVFVFGIIARSIAAHYSLEKEKLEARKNNLQNNKRIIRKWENLEKEYNELKKKFLHGNTLVFKKSVEEKAQETGVNITSLNISRADKEFYREERIRLKLTCPYRNLRDFIKLIEKESIEVEKLNITEAERQINAELDLEGIIFE